jgi:hypothetical protein
MQSLSRSDLRFWRKLPETQVAMQLCREQFRPDSWKTARSMEQVVQCQTVEAVLGFLMGLPDNLGPEALRDDD